MNRTWPTGLAPSGIRRGRRRTRRCRRERTASPGRQTVRRRSIGTPHSRCCGCRSRTSSSRSTPCASGRSKRRTRSTSPRRMRPSPSSPLKGSIPAANTPAEQPRPSAAGTSPQQRRRTSRMLSGRRTESRRPPSPEHARFRKCGADRSPDGHRPSAARGGRPCTRGSIVPVPARGSRKRACRAPRPERRKPTSEAPTCRPCGRARNRAPLRVPSSRPGTSARNAAVS